MAQAVFKTLEEMEQAARLNGNATAATKIMGIIFEVIHYEHPGRCEFFLYSYGNRVLSRQNAAKLFLR